MGKLRFDDRVVVVTGAGNGLGKAHALAYAARGAKVVVNDLGGSAFGDGASAAAADLVVAEIKEAGGEAVANYDSVTDGEKIIQTAMDTWGRVDVVVNNAGILRDVSFHKMTEDDWQKIYDVHVHGSFKVTHAAWPIMREQQYGRIVMTASAAGIYGNFGQANYAMAKLGLVGFSNTLAIEGRKRNIFVNTIAPIAGSRLTETVLPEDLIKALKPEYVAQLLMVLTHEDCKETGGLFEVGGGFFSKLRWQRSAGKTWRLGREISAEQIQEAWDAIAGFDEVTYPASIHESMGPIMSNVQAGPSKGGNDFIDVDAALGYEFPSFKTSYDERDLALYALGVGAASDPVGEDLELVYELHSDGFKALPTFAVIPPINAIIDEAKKGKMAPGLNFGVDRLLHGEQRTELKRPLPPSAKLVHKSKVTNIYDKGKGALVEIETRTYDDDRDLLAVNTFTAFIRGAGGWGGDRGPAADKSGPPEREPDAVIEEQIPENQALLYRLSGDINPLHADPEFAKMFGFDRPILHGLCTYGYAARHVINSFSSGDPRYFKSISARFADSVFPGETLRTEMWKEEDGTVRFQCKVKERDSVVISNARIDFYDEIPKKAPKKKAKAAASGGPAKTEPTSSDVFKGIGFYLEKNADIADRVKNVYLFKLTQPESAWTINLKGGAEVIEGDAGTATCTLQLSDADFMDMVSGKADPMKLFTTGKLKISGDIMASQKLDFLQKVDPKEVQRAMEESGGGGGGAAAAPARTEPTSSDVFKGIGFYLEKHPEVVDRVKTVFLFKLTDPESAWTLDIKDSGAVTAGDAGNAACTLQLSDADFMDMVAGKADPMKLFTSGKLKISGDIMASQKLDFLQKVDPKEVQRAMEESGPATAAAPAAAPAAAKEPAAAGVIEKLKSAIAEHPGLLDEVNAVVQLNISEPESHWALNLTPGGGIESGNADDPVMALHMSDDALARWAGGGDLQGMFQRGDVRVDGDITVAHRLGFVSKS